MKAGDNPLKSMIWKLKLFVLLIHAGETLWSKRATFFVSMPIVMMVHGHGCQKKKSRNDKSSLELNETNRTVWK